MAEEKKNAPTSKLKVCAQTYKRVFNTPDGERVLSDLMRGHSFLSTKFTKDPYELAYLAGQRFVVERIISLLKMDLTVLDKKLETALRKDPFWKDTQDT